MSKKRLNTSGHRSSIPYKTYFFALCALLAALFSASCAPKVAEKPSYEGVPLENVLSELRGISSIEAVLNVEYEKNESVMSGDAFLNLSEDKLNLRLYYLGFLAGEVSEENGIIKSKPKVDRNKSIILVDGLKNSFLWWNLRDYTIRERDGFYVLKNYNREIQISKETLLPVHQTIELDNGEKLYIVYDAPVRHEPGSGDLAKWYQSKLSIKFKNYLVRVKVKSYSVKRPGAPAKS